MKDHHLTQKELTLHYYGEDQAIEETERHLDQCGSCRARLEELSQWLGAIGGGDPPEKGPEYAMKVWQQIHPRLVQPQPWWRLRGMPQWLAPVAGFTCLFLAVFLSGRLLGPQMKPDSLTPQNSSRVFHQAFQQHLDRLQLFWLEAGSSAQAEEQQVAVRALVNENRLYRNIAMQQGRSGMASFLDELEIIMLELANSGGVTADIGATTIKQLDDRTEILFKINIMRSQLEQTDKQIINGKNI